MAISTNQKPTIYRNLYENTDPDGRQCGVEASEEALVEMAQPEIKLYMKCNVKFKELYTSHFWE